MDKNTIRKIFLAKRKILKGKEVKAKSNIIQKKVFELSEIKKSKNLLLYLPINNEVETGLLIKDLKQKKKNVYLPAFFQKTYVIRKFTSFKDLEEGPFNILQPVNNLTIDVDQLDLAILPGVAFDKSGTRLGYGKGVYDQLLMNSKIFGVGLAFDFQVKDKLPRESHDIVLDMLISERNVYRFT